MNARGPDPLVESLEETRGLEVELQRQQALVGALWRDENARATCGQWLAARCDGVPERGLQAYRSNAGAVAERALAGAFPVVQALVGTATFASLARAFWQAEPPWRGDLATLVDRLPQFIEEDARLADVPYLADVARLEAALARAESAADAAGSSTSRLQSLGLLAQHAPEELVIDLAPGAAVIVSRWPIATIWRAHRGQAIDPGALVDESAPAGARAAADADADADANGSATCAASDAMHRARGAIAARLAETVFVWRSEWVGRLEVVDEATAAFLQAVLDDRSLDECHELASRRAAAWSFERWLALAIERRCHAGVRRVHSRKA